MISRAYASEVGRRNAGFDAGRGVVTFDRPVISVGNLSLGGTGKTPMVALIIRALREAGLDPCVAMRGYASRRGAGRPSDEAELYRASFEDLPVVAQPDRVEGLIKLFGTERGDRVDCIVLDDGFQHRRIARTIDLVLVDASQDPFESAVFPAGRLREPVASLARATHILLTHTELIDGASADALAARLADVAGLRDCALAAHVWTSLRENGRTGDPAEREVAWLRGRRVVAACAIGRPGAFLAGLTEAGAIIAEAIVLRDHHPFGGATVRRLLRAGAGVEAIVCTEKDWAKLGKREIAWPCPVVRPQLQMVFRRGWEGLERDILAAGASRPE